MVRQRSATSPVACSASELPGGLQIRGDFQPADSRLGSRQDVDSARAVAKWTAPNSPPHCRVMETSTRDLALQNCAFWRWVLDLKASLERAIRGETPLPGYGAPRSKRHIETQTAAAARSLTRLLCGPVGTSTRKLPKFPNGIAGLTQAYPADFVKCWEQTARDVTVIDALGALERFFGRDLNDPALRQQISVDEDVGVEPPTLDEMMLWEAVDWVIPAGFPEVRSSEVDTDEHVVLAGRVREAVEAIEAANVRTEAKRSRASKRPVAEMADETVLMLNDDLSVDILRRTRAIQSQLAQF